jgi:hypothetical protein
MKGFIKKLLREGLDDSKGLLNKSRLIKLGVEGVFDDKEMASKHLEDLISKIKSLPQSIKLYRIVFVDNINQIDKVNVGSHYVGKVKDLEQSHQLISHVGSGDPYILTVRANKSLIDVYTTLVNNMKYPHENEITLKNKGNGSKIIKIEPFKESEEDVLGGMTSMDDFIFDY